MFSMPATITEVKPALLTATPARRPKSCANQPLDAAFPGWDREPWELEAPAETDLDRIHADQIAADFRAEDRELTLLRDYLADRASQWEMDQATPCYDESWC